MSWLEPVEAGLVGAADAGAVISPAYDLLTPAQRREHGRLHPRSFLNCTPSEGDDPDLDYQGRRQQAQHYLADEIERGTWKFRPPHFYLLQLDSDGHRQIGIVGDVGGNRFPGFVKPHEETRPERVDDLADYLETVSFGSSPVGLAYRRSAAVDEAAEEVMASPAALEVTLEGGDRQTVWVVDDPSRLAAALERIEAAYIIDGHHRVAATLRRGVSPNLPGGRFLAVAFPHDDLAVFPFHRWIDAEMKPSGSTGSGLIPRPGLAIAVTREGEWELRMGGNDGEVDSARLSREVLHPLGVEDERTDNRIAFIPGFPGPEALRRQVDERGGVGFLLAPATIGDVISCSDRGENMPPKATFFTPKPRSGVFLVRR